MKEHLHIMAVFTVFLIIIPCVAFFAPAKELPQERTPGSVRILMTESGRVREFSMQDYMTGAVLAQMPADFEEEALKAQAVLAHTYIMRRIMNEQISPTDELGGADISDDSSKYLAFFTEKQAREFYGEDYEEAYKKISAAVKTVEDEYLAYGGEPITVAFHAISAGKTESAANAWGEDIPYLTACESGWDLDRTGCERVMRFTSEEIAARLRSAYPELDFSDYEEDLWLTPDEISDSGTVLTVRLGEDYRITGQQLAAVLSLPSPCFTVEWSKREFTVTTKGYGHLVGMSQYGADYLASQGENYKDILAHYFPGTVLETEERS